MIQKGMTVGAEIPHDEASLPLSLYVFMAFLCRCDVHRGGLCPPGLFRKWWVFARKFGWTWTTMGVCISKVSPTDTDRVCRARLLTSRLALGAASSFVFGLFLTPLVYHAVVEVVSVPPPPKVCVMHLV